MKKTSVTIREAIDKALHTDQEVQFKLRHCLISMTKAKNSMHIKLMKPVLMQSKLQYEIVDEFINSKFIGLLGIAQTIDMHYSKIKQDLANHNLKLVKQLRDEADACICKAREIEDLMSGK